MFQHPASALRAGTTHRYSPAIGAAGVNRMVSAGVMSGITFVDNAGVEWLKWGDRRLERLADIGEQLNGPAAKARMRKHRNESTGLME